ncbi:MAG TPA: polysaccharide lyase [Gaiellaceae bacterium]|jgi:hypothetical protein|nr:polysaccharide lyase [Gaiellaceae bacterium]
MAAAALLAAPAWGETSCRPGYSYAGQITSRPVHGIRAWLSAPLDAQVQNGDVSGWIGIGRTRARGKRGLIRVGLLALPGSSSRLYFERRRSDGSWVRSLGPAVAPGEAHKVALNELTRRRGHWRVVIDGRPVSRAFRLGGTRYGKYALATAESWSGGTAVCNELNYFFRRVSVKRSAWNRLRTPRLVQDPGYTVVRRAPGIFSAKNTPDPVLFSGDWETGDATQWSVNQWNRNFPLSDQFRIVTDPVRQGRYAAKFIVRPGDKFGTTSGERSEVAYVGANETQDDAYWYGWSVLFPRDWTTPSGWAYFTQWHSRFPVPPPIAFNVKDDRLFVYTNTGQLNANGVGTNKVGYQFAASLRRGEWNDFVVHIVWSATNGSIAVWHRAGGDPFAKALEVSGIPTLQTSNGVISSNYLKLGLYRNADSTDTDALYQDGFHRGRSPTDLRATFGDDPAYQALLAQLSG